MQKICYLLLVVMLVASGKNYGRSSNPTHDHSGSGTLKINVDGVSFKMIKVKGGTFQMWSESAEHSVTLSDYYIGETEVTQALWKAVMGNNPSEFKGDNLPVDSVSWKDCQKFIKKLNKLTGRRFALPTEAQWEFAARGGNKSRGYKYSGSNNIDDVTWYGGNSSSQTHPVGTKMANELGLYDMTGNVREWCSDRYGDYSSSSQTDPTGPSTGSSRVLRGGGWYNFASYCSSTFRDYRSPGYRRNGNLGLRLVLHDGQPEEPQIEATVTIQSDKAVLNVNGIIANLVKVEGGTFQMGSENGEDYEKPVHSVTLSNYFIGETEVTQALWKAVMGNNPSEFKGDNLPVDSVSWKDCQKFIKKLNKLTGRRFALPTEAQWEFAARGGNKSRGYEYSGSNNIDDVTWYGGNSSSQTHPVGTKMANELGLYDMSGNVWEWCSDRYGDYSSSSQTDPIGSSTGSYRVLRGGCWFINASGCRSAGRLSSFPGFRFSSNGFRLVLLDGQPEEPQIEATVTIQSDKAVLNVNGIIANLVKVKGGTFQMGSENGDEDEQPIHSVTLSGYYIGETEVTQALWQAVMGSNPSWFKGDNLPVESVSWDDCQEFISKLNQKTGRRFALPTEAQWEFAARGGNKSRGYEYSGSNNIDDVAWYGDNSEQTHPVGTKMANELGLYDMSGNVLEWCSDWHDSYSSSSQTDPVGPSTGSGRVSRGGSWFNFASYCRSTYRYNINPDSRYNGDGFRLVLLF